jgi:2-succinyl-5-enolpyruvyl-6-hydroxy-3-cyclohexene-1-carboxylate synthase
MSNVAVIAMRNGRLMSRPRPTKKYVVTADGLIVTGVGGFASSVVQFFTTGWMAEVLRACAMGAILALGTMLVHKLTQTWLDSGYPREFVDQGTTARDERRARDGRTHFGSSSSVHSSQPNAGTKSSWLDEYDG